MPVVLGYKTVVGICEDVVKYKCFRQIKVLLFEIAHKHFAMFLKFLMPLRRDVKAIDSRPDFTSHKAVPEGDFFGLNTNYKHETPLSFILFLNASICC